MMLPRLYTTEGSKSTAAFGIVSSAAPACSVFSVCTIDNKYPSVGLWILVSRIFGYDRSEQ